MFSKKSIACFFGVWVLAACAPSSKSIVASTPKEPNGAQTDSSDVAKARYLKGGFYPGPISPGGLDPVDWSHNMTLSVAADGGVDVQAAIPGSTCTKSSALSARDSDRILSELRGIELIMADESKAVADMGKEMLTIEYRSGRVETIYLSDSEVPVGSFVALNGPVISQLYRDFYDSMAVKCP